MSFDGSSWNPQPWIVAAFSFWSDFARLPEKMHFSSLFRERSELEEPKVTVFSRGVAQLVR